MIQEYNISNGFDSVFFKAIMYDGIRQGVGPAIIYYVIDELLMPLIETAAVIADTKTTEPDTDYQGRYVLHEFGMTLNWFGQVIRFTPVVPRKCTPLRYCDRNLVLVEFK